MKAVMKTVSPEPGVDLTALAAEAHRRGMSYGQLVANTGAAEQYRIVKDYIRRRQEERERERAEQAAPTGAGRKRMDRARAMELYRQGKSDREIAEELGVKAPTVAGWRMRYDLPAAGRKRMDRARAAELYRQGKNDREIAEELGVRPAAVCKWRKRSGLTGRGPGKPPAGREG